MSRTLRRLIPSPAMIVALVALVVSLGSSGYAQRFVPAITGGDIANNSVTGADIRNTSLTRKDIRKRESICGPSSGGTARPYAAKAVRLPAIGRAQPRRRSTSRP
jgi:hypothetical protein